VPTSLEFQARLIALAQIQTSEGFDGNLGQWLLDALNELDPSIGSLSAVTPELEHSLLTLAQIRVCFARANKHVNAGNLRSDRSGYGHDRDGPFEKNLKLCESLRKEFDNQKKKLGIEENISAPGLQVGTLYRQSDFIDNAVQQTTFNLLPKPVVLVNPVIADEVIVQWDFSFNEHLRSFMVLTSPTVGIVQAWNRDSTSGIAGVSDDTEIVTELIDVRQRAVKLIDLVNPSTSFLVIAAKDAHGRYSFSDEFIITNPQPGTPPADPTGLYATGVSQTQIDLNWTDNATDEATYTVQRSDDGTTGWADLATLLAANTVTYPDASVTAGQKKFYRVKAVNAFGDSAYSNIEDGTALP